MTMATTHLTLVVIAMIIAVTVVAIVSIVRTGKIVRLTPVAATFVSILATLIGS